MKRVLFVSNGHGEEAIASRIASELPRESYACDHLALVGEFGHPSVMADVGPRRTMPSGGLIAMGNVRNIARDVRGGLIGLTFAQLAFLRRIRGTYDCVVAVGDAFALFMSLLARAPAVFVGTAKSVYLAPYGPMEERIVARARRVFVRDDATARRLESHGLAAEAANVITDLHRSGEESPLPAHDPFFALFPGSREAAYADAVFLTRVAARLLRDRPGGGAALSIAPGLQVHEFAQRLVAAGFRIAGRDDAREPFVVRDGEREIVRAYRGDIGAMISRATLVLGQAGTANEAAAAAGVPVVAFDLQGEKKGAWYRMRQSALLGDALFVADGSVDAACAQIGALLGDAARMRAMSETGRERMGEPGGARRIASAIREVCAGAGTAAE